MNADGQPSRSRRGVVPRQRALMTFIEGTAGVQGQRVCRDCQAASKRRPQLTSFHPCLPCVLLWLERTIARLDMCWLLECGAAAPRPVRCPFDRLADRYARTAEQRPSSL